MFLLSERGFSYLWVLFMILLMGVFSMLAVDLYRVKKQQEDEKILIYEGHEFRKAIKSYYRLSNKPGINGYPISLEQLIKDDRYPNTIRHLRKLYIDPMTGKSDWVLVKVGNRIVGVHSASKSKVLKKSNFLPEDVTLENKNTYNEWVFSYPSNLSMLSEKGVKEASDGNFP